MTGSLSVRTYWLLGLAGSLALHSLIFNSIIFVFPVNKIQPKPDFIFLGSILRNDDLRATSFNDIQSDSINYQKFLTSIIEHSEDHTKKSDLNKPQDETLSRHLPKPNVKSLVESNTAPKEATATEILNELGIDVNQPAYQPISRQSDAKN